jgi:hypothetical protein
MEISNRSIEASCKLFIDLKCCSDGPRKNGDFTSDIALASLDEEKMMCLIINCSAALNILQAKRGESEASGNEKHESVKRKVFKGACSILINADSDSNQSDIKKSLLSAFPDESKMSNDQSWLPLHFAIALLAEGKISEEDV